MNRYYSPPGDSQQVTLQLLPQTDSIPLVIFQCIDQHINIFFCSEENKVLKSVCAVVWRLSSVLYAAMSRYLSDTAISDA
jgi:hypothetical protein